MTDWKKVRDVLKRGGVESPELERFFDAHQDDSYFDEAFLILAGEVVKYKRLYEQALDGDSGG